MGQWHGAAAEIVLASQCNVAAHIAEGEHGPRPTEYSAAQRVEPGPLPGYLKRLLRPFRARRNHISLRCPIVVMV
jgi:hypothetical protein